MNNLKLCPYLVGCLIGDGGLVGNLTFATTDLDIRDYVNESLAKYNYCLKPRSVDSARGSEYTIAPKQNNKIKYLFRYQGNDYVSSELLQVLQSQNYPVRNNDTLLSIVGKSTKTRKSNILTYFPELSQIECRQLKETQQSIFINHLNSLNLRCRFDEKRIPKEYLDACFEDRLLLFQGLMDTDGSISSNKRLEFCVSNEALATDFAKLAESLGYTFKIYTKQSKYFNKKYNEMRYGKLAYRVLLNYNNKITPFRCKRKLDLYIKNIGGNYESIPCCEI